MAPHERAEHDGEVVITFHVTRGQQYRIAQVTIDGNTSVPLADLQPGLRLREGQPFSQAALDAEAASIEDVYRRSGFGAAKADIDVKPQAPTSGQVPVAVTFTVREGVRTLVGSVKVTGNARSGDDAARRPSTSTGPAVRRREPRRRPRRDSGALSQRRLRERDGRRQTGAQSRSHAGRRRLSQFARARRCSSITCSSSARSGRAVDCRKAAAAARRRSAEPRRGRSTASAGCSRSGCIATSSSASCATARKRGATCSSPSKKGPPPASRTAADSSWPRRVEPSDTSQTRSEGFDAAPRGSFQISRRNLFGTNRSASLFTSLTLHPQGTGATADYHRVSRRRHVPRAEGFSTRWSMV